VNRWNSWPSRSINDSTARPGRKVEVMYRKQDVVEAYQVLSAYVFPRERQLQRVRMNEEIIGNLMKDVKVRVNTCEMNDDHPEV
jgi:hypothetical protein